MVFYFLLLIPIGIAGVGAKHALDRHKEKKRQLTQVKPIVEVAAATAAAAARKGNIAAPMKRKKATGWRSLQAQKLEAFLNEVRAGDVPRCMPASRRYHGIMYHDCIRGSDFMDALVQKNICGTPYQALTIARRLFETGCIYHVTDYPKFRVGDYFYRVSSRPATLVVATDKILSSLRHLNEYSVKAKEWLNTRPTHESVVFPSSFGQRAGLFSHKSSASTSKSVSAEALATALVVVGSCNRRTEWQEVKQALLQAKLISCTKTGRFVFVNLQPTNKVIQEGHSLILSATKAA